MGIKTDDVKVGTGNLPKSFSPGNRIAKINNVTLRWPSYLKAKGEKAYEVVIDLETKPEGESFEGWLIDAKNEKGPRYLGQTGRIKSRKWPYKDGSWTGGGKTIKFDMVDDILKVIKLIELECGTNFLGETSGKYNTREEEMQDNGHPKYFMYLPKFSGTKLFAKESEADTVLTYDKALHVEVKGGAKPVNSFAAPTDVTANAGGANDLWDSSDKDEDPFAVDPNADEDPFAVED